MTNIFWVDNVSEGRVGLAARPRGRDWLEDDLTAWRRAHANIVVSLLTDEENMELGLEAEDGLCGKLGLQFVSFPIPDRGVPQSTSAFIALLQTLDTAVERGKNIVVHCRQGIGRSALLAASLLIHSGDLQADKAFEIVAAARGCVVPDTTEQHDWVSSRYRLLQDKNKNSPQGREQMNGR